MADLRAGSTFAGFTIETLIDRGGMSAVYRAEERALGRRVALKVMDDEVSADATFRQLFVNEARRASAIDHPNILPIYRFGDEEGLLFIAMRYVDGGRDLGKIIDRRGALTPDETMSLLTQAARALDRVHGAGLVHRDVKPENLLVAGSDDLEAAHVYLSDFGLVQLVTSSAGRSAASFAGTLGYAAPEQIRDEPADLRADVYGLGAVLFRCLTGELPYVADNDAALMYAHLHAPVPTLADRDPTLAVVDPVIAMALAKDPDDRFSSCGALVAAAAAALEPMLSDAAVTRVRRPVVDAEAATVVRDRSGPPLPIDQDAATVARPGPGSPSLERTPADAGRHAGPPGSPGSPAADRAGRSRWPWRLVVGLAVVIAVVAAGLALRSRSSTTTDPGAPPVAVAGGTLTLAAATTQSGWNPTHDLWSVTDRLVASTVFDPLVLATPSGYEPYLAASVTAADATRWTIVLRPGVTFHDGTALDASAVKDDLDAAQKDPVIGSLMADVDRTEVNGPLRLDVHLVAPWPSFPSLLAGQVGYIAAPSMLHGDGATPVGTGPFVYDPSSKSFNAILTKNPHYWQSGKPVLDRVVIHRFDTPDQQIQDLESDTANVALVSATSLNESTSGGYVTADVGVEATTVVFNTTTAPTDDVHLRQALGAATDRGALAAGLGGSATLASGPIAVGPTGTAAPWPPNHESYVPFDPEKAKAFISDYRKVSATDVTLNVLSAASLDREVRPLLAMWADNGFTRIRASTDTQSQVIAKTTSGSAPSVSIMKIEVPSDPSGMQPLFRPVTAAPSMNLARWEGSVVAGPFDQARGETDPEARRALYDQALTTTNTALPYLWLYEVPVVLVTYHGVSNLPGQTVRPVFTDLAAA